MLYICLIFWLPIFSLAFSLIYMALKWCMALKYFYQSVLWSCNELLNSCVFWRDRQEDDASVFSDCNIALITRTTLYNHAVRHNNKQSVSVRPWTDLRGVARYPCVLIKRNSRPLESFISTCREIGRLCVKGQVESAQGFHGDSERPIYYACWKYLSWDRQVCLAVPFVTLGECGTCRESNSTHFIKPWAGGRKKLCAWIVGLHYFIQGPPNQPLFFFFFFFNQSLTMLRKCLSSPSFQFGQTRISESLSWTDGVVFTQGASELRWMHRLSYNSLHTGCCRSCFVFGLLLWWLRIQD